VTRTPLDRHDTDTTAAAVERLRMMCRIRGFEERTSSLYRDGQVPGFVHLSTGQEAVAVGVCSALRRDDVITSTHRGHGHVLAKGADISAMFAELMGRATGTCGGFGGSMHIADPGLGIFGANGIVGAGIPIATGAAWAMRLRAQDRVAVTFFGDGAVSTGAFHEAANLAALWKLPLLLVCENNGYSEFSRTEDQHPVDLATRAAGYGIAHTVVDGNDVEAVHAVTAELVAGLRAGAGPFFLEARTLRLSGHYEGDPQRYRRGDPGPDLTSDPLGRAEMCLTEAGVDPEVLAGLRRQVIGKEAAVVLVSPDRPQRQQARVKEGGVQAAAEPVSHPIVVLEVAAVGIDGNRVFVIEVEGEPGRRLLGAVARKEPLEPGLGGRGRGQGTAKFLDHLLGLLRGDRVLALGAGEELANPVGRDPVQPLELVDLLRQQRHVIAGDRRNSVGRGRRARFEADIGFLRTGLGHLCVQAVQIFAHGHSSG